MKKLIMRIGLCAVLLLALCVSTGVLFRICVNRRIDCRTTLIAARDIPPRTMITEADVIEVEIPYQYLLNGTCNDKREVIGMFTEIQGMIPAGSPFYRCMLYDSEDLPDHPEIQLMENQACYAVQVDSAALGNLVKGMRCDIHVSINRRDENPITGCVIQNARIVEIKDYQGYPIDSMESTGIPYLAEVAVSRNDLDLLSLAEQEGQIRFFSSETAYERGTGSVRAKDNSVIRYLEAMMDQEETDAEVTADRIRNDNPAMENDGV